jgi:hypothetical protein
MHVGEFQTNIFMHALQGVEPAAAANESENFLMH